MVSADLGRACLVALLALSHQHLGVVLGVAFGLSVGTVFFSPAAGSALPAMVEESDLVAAKRTCCGRPAGWPRWRWAPWSPRRSASARSI